MAKIFFQPKKFLNPTLVCTQNFFASNIFYPKIFWTIFFAPKHWTCFFTLNFFFATQRIIAAQIFLESKMFLPSKLFFNTEIVFDPYFLQPKHNLDPVIFVTEQFFQPKIFGTNNYSWDNKFFYIWNLMMTQNSGTSIWFLPKTFLDQQFFQTHNFYPLWPSWPYQREWVWPC